MSSARACHLGVLGGEAVIVDEIAPDRLGVAAAPEGRLDQLAIRLAGAGSGRGSRRSHRAQRAGNPWRMSARVGGHLYGRSCRGVPPPARELHGEPGGFEVGAGRLAPCPVARWMCRSVQPSRLSARTFCLLSSLKMLIMRVRETSRRVNVLSAYSLWPVLGVDRGAGVHLRCDGNRRRAKFNASPGMGVPSGRGSFGGAITYKGQVFGETERSAAPRHY